MQKVVSLTNAFKWIHMSISKCKLLAERATCNCLLILTCRSWESSGLGKKSLLVFMCPSFHQRGPTLLTTWEVLIAHHASWTIKYLLLRHWLSFLQLFCSIEIAISRLREQENISRKPSQNLKACSQIALSCKLFFFLGKKVDYLLHFWHFFLYLSRTLLRMTMRKTLFRQWSLLVKLV